MNARCHVCGSTAIANPSEPHSPVCDACLPVKEHVISMQTGRAVCQCGWRTKTATKNDREVEIQQHWRDMIAQAAAT